MAEASGFRRLLFRTPIYRWMIRPRRPVDIATPLTSLWPGDAARGRALVDDELALGGRAFTLPGSGWTPIDAPSDWRAALDSFDWLADLRDLGGDLGRRRARELVGRWLDRYRRWDPLSWRPDVTGRRIAAWLGHHGFFCASADDEFRERVLFSLAAQARHLARTIDDAPAGADRIAAIKGVVLAAVGLTGLAVLLMPALMRLEAALAEQVLADGGHSSRSPSVHLAALRDLIEIRHALRLARITPPPALVQAIEAMVAMLRYLRHGDGGLALFNGSNEEPGPLIDAVIQQSESRPRLAVGAPDFGIERLHAGRTTVFIDCGDSVATDGRVYAGPLSFELSIGRERLIVNLGGSALLPEAWATAQRATAAHSTLTIDDTNAIHLEPGAPASSIVKGREDSDGQIWFEATHDGYADRLGASHQRRLYLSADGEDLRGEEVVTGAAGKPYQLRFHLHPRVQVSLAQNAAAALLKLPSGSGFRLRVSGGRLDLGEAVYLGRPDEMKRTQHLLVTGVLDGQTSIKWALRREGKR
ncbi:MAG: hypothetical protein FJX60_02075 [Alphaproteobacteria bacterium]|nr:hypothetical protein [Alphaproteobacteria bacterium]